MQFQVIVIGTSEATLLTNDLLPRMHFIHMMIQIQFRIEGFIASRTFDVFFHLFFGVYTFFIIILGFAFASNPAFFAGIRIVILTISMRPFVSKMRKGILETFS